MKLITTLIILSISISVFAQNPKYMIGRGYGETYTIDLKNGESFSEFKKTLKTISMTKDSLLSYRYYLGMPFDVPFRLKVIPKNSNVKTMRLFLVGDNVKELSKIDTVYKLKLKENNDSVILKKYQNKNFKKELQPKSSGDTILLNKIKNNKSKDVYEVEFYTMLKDSSFIFYMPPLNVSKEYDFQFIEDVEIDTEVIRFIERFYNYLLDQEFITLNEKSIKNPYFRNYKFNKDEDYKYHKIVTNPSKHKITKENLIKDELKRQIDDYDENLNLNVTDIDLNYKDDLLKSVIEKERKNINNYKINNNLLINFYKSNIDYFSLANINSEDNFLDKFYGLFDFKSRTTNYTFNDYYLYITEDDLRVRIRNIDTLRTLLSEIPYGNTNQDTINYKKYKNKYTIYLDGITEFYKERINVKNEIQTVIAQKAERIVGNEFNDNLTKSEQGVLKSNTHADYKTRTEYFVTADVGLAYLISKDYYNEIQPYFGVNFNFGAINRQVHYSMFKKMKYKMKFWPRIWKNTSVMVGVSFDLNGAKASSKSLSSNKELHTTFSTATTKIPINLYTGLGIRIWDPVRINGGVVWTKEHTTISTSESYYKLKPTGFVSVAFDIDVGKYLGQFGNVLFFNRTANF